jgi:hypothetical protein
MSIDKDADDFMISYKLTEDLKTTILEDTSSFELRNGKRHILQGNFGGLSDIFLLLLE